MATEEESPPDASTEEDLKATITIREVPPAPYGRISDVTMSSSSCSDVDGKDSRAMEGIDADVMVPDLEAEESNGADSADPVDKETSEEGSVPVAMKTMSHDSVKIPGADQPGAQEVPAEVVEDSNESFLSSANDTDNADTESDSKQNKLNVEANDTINAEGGSNDIGKKIIEATTATGDDDIAKASANSPRSSKEYEPSMLPNVESDSLTKNEMNDISDLTAPDKSELPTIAIPSKSDAEEDLSKRPIKSTDTKTPPPPPPPPPPPLVKEGEKSKRPKGRRSSNARNEDDIPRPTSRQTRRDNAHSHHSHGHSRHSKHKHPSSSSRRTPPRSKPDVDNPTGSSSSPSSSSSSANRHRVPSVKETKPYPSPPSVGSSATTSSRKSSSPSPSRTPKPSSESPTSSLVGEAERQAAIAAAIAANASSMSPSVAAGIAKVLALPSLMGGRVGGVGGIGGGGGGMIGGMGGFGSSHSLLGSSFGNGGNAGRSLSPHSSQQQQQQRQQQLQQQQQVRHDSQHPHNLQPHHHHYHHHHHKSHPRQSHPAPPPHPPGNVAPHQMGPTMVALPPQPPVPPPPQPLPPRMKPVRFEDVRVAFDELLWLKENGGDGQNEGEEMDGHGEKKKEIEMDEDNEKNKNDQKGNVGVKDEVPTDADEKNVIEKDNQIEFEATKGEYQTHSNDGVKVDLERGEGEDGEDGEDGAASSPNSVKDAVKTEHGVETKSIEDVMKGEDTETKEQQSKEVETKPNSLSCIDKESGEDTKENAADSAPSSDIAKTGVHSSPETMTDGKNESKNDFDKSMNEGGNSCDAEIRETNGEHAGEAFEDTKKSKSDAADAEPKVPRTTIPDAFLRFLLLVARVPIILEGNEKLPITPRAGDKKAFYKSKNRKVTDAAKIASKRALEVLILAQNAFDTVSEKQKQLLQDQAKFDATLSFFAACAGELDSGMKTSESKEKSAEKNAKNERPPQKQRRRASLTSSTNAAAAAVVSASTVFSNVMSKVTKKQGAFSDLGKKWMAGAGASTRVDQTSESKEVQNFSRSSDNDDSSTATTMEDYEIVIDQEMLGLTVENVLERTIIRTLLPDGAAKRTGAKIGSLIAKVGNVDTSNLTHFETIDELRQSQRPLKLTLRHISSDVLRCAREEMGRLIRGRGWASSEEIEENSSRPWKGSLSSNKTKGETFDSLLRERWPSKSNSNVASSNQNGTPPIFTRAEMMHQNGKDLIRILSLLVVGMEKELSDLQHNSFHQEEESTAKRLTSKELTEAIEITSKILLDYARGHPDVVRKPLDNANDGNKGSSFFPTPPGRVQGKKHGAPGGNTKPAKGKKGLHESPLLRIGDALQRTRSFLVESSSITAATLRWEIIDYLCIVLDLDTEQELSENEAASSTEGGEASPINDLGSAGSILKLIVLNCTTAEDSITGSGETSDTDSISTANQIARNKRNAGNCFLSVVHRLAASKSVSARVSACSLGPVLWNHLDFPRQLQLRGVITRALHDVDVGVRKATAAVVHEISEMLFDRRAVPWTVLMVERSMTDPEPQLRAAAMTLTWHLAEHLPNAFLGDASKGSLSIRRLPPRTDPTFMDVYLLQCKLLPVASNLAEDRIASVRLSVAAQCDRLCSALGEHWFSVIIDLLQALLSDRDDRVRSEAILCMPRLVESVILGASEDRSVSVLESLLPQALKMQKDASVVVRSSLATATGELLVFLVGLGGAGGSLSPPPSPGQGGVHIDEVGSFKYYKKHVDQTLIPLLQKLLQDTNPDVTSASLRAVTNASRSGARDRSSIPSCAHKPDVDDDLVSLASHQSHSSIDRTKPVFIPVLSEEQVLRLLPTLSNLATSSQWRVRQSAVEIVPALLGCTYRLETRNEISKLCIRLMSDKVDTVRKTAAECFCLGGSSLARHGEDDGGEWITKIVVPHLRTCSQSEDSKQRLLSLKMIEIIITNGLCPAKGSDPASSPGSFDDSFSSTDESPMRMLLEIASSRASDNVANVRLNVGRVLGSVFFLLDRSDVDYVVSVLERQLEDETSKANGGDRDVVYFAQQALASRSLRRLESR